MSENSVRRSGGIALVTGASRGIGRACAIELAKSYSHVVAAARNCSALMETVRLCSPADGRASMIETDMRDLGSIRLGVRSIEERIGPIDLLVNCAGVDNSRSFTDITENDWDLAFETNLKGLFFCTQEVVRHMLPRGNGLIINVSSILGLRTGQLPYTITKWGLEGFTKSLARELTPRGIRVNAVAPGVTATAMTGFGEEDPLEVETQYHPMGRVASPKEIAAAVAFLASDQASYVNGATLVVDGGALIM